MCMWFWPIFSLGAPDIVELGPQVATQGVWSADLAKEISTTGEILAVRKVLQSFAPKLKGLCVKWQTGNQVACT